MRDLHSFMNAVMPDLAKSCERILLPGRRRVAVFRTMCFVSVAVPTLVVLCCFSQCSALGAELKPLVFLADKDYPPMTYLEGGVAKGMDGDLCKALGTRMKRDVRIELMDWNLAQEKVLNGEGDSLTGMSISGERRTQFDFSVPMFKREFGLLVRHREVTIHDTGDLKGKNVGVTPGGFPKRFLEAQRGVNLVLITNYHDGFDRLTAGTIDAIAADLWVAAYLIEKGRVYGVTIAGKPFATADAAIAVMKGNTALLEEINRAINSLEADGTIARIREDWRPQEMLFVSRRKVRELIMVAIGVLLLALLGAMALWIFTLKRQIRIRKRAESDSRESEERFSNLTQAAFEGISISEGGRVVDVNDQCLKMFGYERSEMIGRNVVELVARESRDAVAEAIRTGQESIYEHRLVRKDESVFYAEARAKMVHVGNRTLRMTALRDISERKQAEALTNTQMQVLEMIDGGRPMAETLNALLQMVQAQSQEMLCSILLLDRDWLHVCHGAAPSLPADYVKAIDGAAIGPCAGSCGTAMFRREPVFVADIENDPLWADYKHLALPHGLRACWSTPIFDAQRNVLGTFAIYFRKPGLPDERHLRLIDVATHTAAVCIAKQRADDALRNTEESLRATIQNTPNVAVQWYDRNGKVMFWNRASELLYGWTAAEAAGKSLDQLIFDRPEAEAFQQALLEIERTGTPVGPVEFPLHHRSGRTGVVLSTVFRIQLASGEARFVCMDVDLTDRKRAEAERADLAIRERQAREDFTRRLIVRQEAERSRIAGELHDSLGQNLLLIKNRAHIALSRADTPPDMRHQLENISEMASEAIAEVRQISHDLHPHQLDLLGLTRAIEAMIDGAAQASGVAIERKLDAVDDVFPTDAATHLYRVVQECLTNAIKHAQARSVRVELERDVRHVCLWVKDDGRGFKPEQAPADGGSGGLGLKNIAERVRILNGELRINTRPEAGTTIGVWIPIPSDK